MFCNKHRIIESDIKKERYSGFFPLCLIVSISSDLQKRTNRCEWREFGRARALAHLRTCIILSAVFFDAHGNFAPIDTVVNTIIVDRATRLKLDGCRSGKYRVSNEDESSSIARELRFLKNRDINSYVCMGADRTD